VVQVLNTDRIQSGSSIFFHYLNDDEHPDISASFAPNRCMPDNYVTFDLFSFDGYAANIESVLFGKGDYERNLFIIVSWVYNLDGVNTVGKYYSVFAYDYVKGVFTKNEKLTNILGSGQDGLVDGKCFKFKFKTAADIWAYLKNRR
jgi:hypothetical protein